MWIIKMEQVGEEVLLQVGRRAQGFFPAAQEVHEKIPRSPN